MGWFCQQCQHSKTTTFHHLVCPIQVEALHREGVLVLSTEELHAAMGAAMQDDSKVLVLVAARRQAGYVGLSQAKARRMLHEGVVRGKPISERQRRFFGWVAGGGANHVGAPMQTSSSKGAIVFDEESLVLANSHFRQVFSTTVQQQIVFMAISEEDGEIPEEVHSDTTQTLRVFSGTGMLYANDIVHPLQRGSVVVVSPGTRHRIVQTGELPLRLSSTYCPPEHAEDLVQPTRISSQTAGLRRIVVERVIDGDTVVSKQGKHYRLYGIDAPERKQAYGDQATAALEKMALSTEVFLQKHGKDKYNRQLATLYSVAQPNQEWQNINYVMVALGRAWAYLFVREARGEPLVPALQKYEQAQRVAQKNRLGLWKAEVVERPQDFRRKNKRKL
jgi:micrococcal nuclease